MAKNVLQRHWDGTKFVEIHPVTKALNVFTSDSKSIEQKVNEHQAEDATILKKGHVQLSSAVTSLDETKAATPKAVKSAMDRADAAFTSASNGKTAVKNAVAGVDPTVVIPTDPTFPQLATAIGKISTGKKWANGTVTSSSDKMYFRNYGLTSNTYVPYITLPPFGFTPSTIILFIGDTSICIYHVPNNRINVVDNEKSGSSGVLQYDPKISPVIFTQYGAILPVNYNGANTQFTWVAFE